MWAEGAVGAEEAEPGPKGPPGAAGWWLGAGQTRASHHSKTVDEATIANTARPHICAANRHQIKLLA